MAATALALALTMLLAAPAARAGACRCAAGRHGAGRPAARRSIATPRSWPSSKSGSRPTAPSIASSKRRIPALPKEATPRADRRAPAGPRRLDREDPRPRPRPGDIFTKEMRALFRRYLARVFHGPEGRELRASIMDENPGRLRLHINARYPESDSGGDRAAAGAAGAAQAARRSRISVHRGSLILHDIHAHTIVDIIDGAIPH